jgi:hypothetical protein
MSKKGTRNKLQLAFKKIVNNPTLNGKIKTKDN